VAGTAARVNSAVGHFSFLTMRILVLASLLLVAPFGANRFAQDTVPPGWQRIDAEGYFAFYLPSSMQLRSTKRCEECAWGSTYADEHISLHATYTSWNEGYTAEYLNRQPEYQRQITEIGGKKAKIESWRSSELPDGFAYFAEARFYGDNGKLTARLSASCKLPSDVDTAKQIFRTVGSFKR
jgi:hypothetical protein